jgi:hypothetical protein
MRISIGLREQLRKLGTFRDKVEILEFANDAVIARAEIEAADTFGCALSQLSWSLVKGGTCQPAHLRAMCDRIVNKVTYLLEPLRVFEIDEEQQQAQLRSREPSPHDEGKAYFEFRLGRQGSIVLQRFMGQTGQPRRPILASLTNEVLGKVLDDVAEILAQGS